ncbi:type VI secretion system-associated protein TagO [Orbus sturtevantii]|uniref:type VI secretion system-associated protein TagO n=1 Tax=Orbus sturtevantii TaxID=3074109 RepID=UPI00370DD9B6
MNKKILISLLFLAGYAFSSNNELSTKINFCKNIKEKESRLTCYDVLFETKAEVKVTSNDTGKWKIQEDASPIDDSKTVVLMLNADAPIQVRYDHTTPYLVIRCKENKTVLYVGFGTFLGSDRITPITRVDTEKAVSNITWSISTDHEAMFYDGAWGGPGVKKTTDFIKELSDKNKYFIQVTPYSESPVNTTFTLTGLDEAIKPLRAACGW